MPFESVKNVLSTLQSAYPDASLNEVLVCCNFELMVANNYQPTINELAGSSNVPRTSVSRWLAKYQAQGLLKTVVDQDDERALRVHQTDEGRAFKRDLGEYIPIHK